MWLKELVFEGFRRCSQIVPVRMRNCTRSFVARKALRPALRGRTQRSQIRPAASRIRAREWRRRPIPFGKYDLLERINIGGMAEILKARDITRPGSSVIAVKRILPHL